MSRSYRHYSGLLHTHSDANVVESFKKAERRRLRSAMNGGDEDALELGKRCHRSNLFDRCVKGGAYPGLLKWRSNGYKIERVNHKLRGK